MKSLLLAAIVGVLLSTSPAAAITCDEFLTGIQKADAEQGDLLPEFAIEESDFLPGHFEITNLVNIETGMTCRNEQFGGFGAVLLEGSEPDLARWILLARSMLLAVAPEADALAVIEELQSTAFTNAERTEIRQGIYSGTAEMTLESYDLVYVVMRDMISFDILTK